MSTATGMERFRIEPGIGLPAVIDPVGNLTIGGTRLGFLGADLPQIYADGYGMAFHGASTAADFNYTFGVPGLPTLARFTMNGEILFNSNADTRLLIQSSNDEDSTLTLYTSGSGGQTRWDLIAQSPTSSAPSAFTIADATTGTRRLNIHPGSAAAPIELLATGELLLAVDPTSPMGAVTKQYADAITSAGGAFLPLVGGTLTGDLIINTTGTTAGLTLTTTDPGC